MVVDRSLFDRQFEIFKNKRVILFGPPAGGKTSFMRELTNKLPGLEYISLGAISRSVDPESVLGKQIAQLHSLACPWPADLVVDMVVPAIKQCIENEQGFVLDGVPRKLDEYYALQNRLKELGISIDVVLELQTPDVVVLERLETDSANREKRAESNVHYLKRLEMYRQQTQPVITLMANEFGAEYITIDTTQGLPESLIYDLVKSL
jgi:adenylate kinase